ncbi:hypothetical protein Tco_1427600 [Tanacetum coccineum]
MIATRGTMTSGEERFKKFAKLLRASFGNGPIKSMLPHVKDFANLVTKSWAILVDRGPIEPESEDLFSGLIGKRSVPRGGSLWQAIMTAPTAKSLASHMISKGKSQSGATRIGAWVNFILRVSNASMHSFEKINGVSFSRRSLPLDNSLPPYRGVKDGERKVIDHKEKSLVSPISLKVTNMVIVDKGFLFNLVNIDQGSASQKGLPKIRRQYSRTLSSNWNPKNLHKILKLVRLSFSGLFFVGPQRNKEVSAISSDELAEGRRAVLTSL